MPAPGAPQPGQHPAGARYRLAAEDQDFATLVFVTLRLGPGVIAKPQIGAVLPGVRGDAF